VYRLPGDAEVPSWAGGGAFTSVSRSRGELSVLCAWRPDASAVPVIGPLSCCCLDGPLDFSLTGILAGLTQPLAAAGVSVFCVATYDTDYLLVPEKQRLRAQACMETSGVHFADAGDAGK
jgi:hypothetical protein